MSVPSGGPRNLTAIPVSLVEVMATWSTVTPIDQNGIITMYEVLYWPLPIQNGSRAVRAVNTSELRQKLVLTQLGSYGVSVRAYTNIGSGPNSESVNFTVGMYAMKFCTDLYTSCIYRIPSSSKFISN